MARAYAELFDARPLRLTTFPNEEGYDELVLARAIPFRTVCEHHLLPFAGVAHVGYLPGERILGLSKLARLVEHFAARPQTQERLTRQVADCLAARLAPRGAGVVLEAEHTCMTLRGVRALGSHDRHLGPAGHAARRRAFPGGVLRPGRRAGLTMMPPRGGKERIAMTDALAALSKAGVSIWLDDLSRERLVSGSLAGLAARDHVVGVTTNPGHFRQGDHRQRRLSLANSVTCPRAASTSGRRCAR